MKTGFYKMPNGSKTKYFTFVDFRLVLIDLKKCINRSSVSGMTIHKKIKIEKIEWFNLPMNLLIAWGLNYDIMITDGTNFKIIGNSVPKDYFTYAVQKYQEVFAYIDENYKQIKL